jgi:hypothetical protein
MKKYMPGSSAYLVLPDKEICQDYLQSKKNVEQTFSSVVVATVQTARAAHRKQLLTGSVGAVKGVSRWSLDEHIPFRGESEKVRGELPSPGRQTLLSAKSCWLSDHRL